MSQQSFPTCLAVVGLGYVGIQVATAFGRVRRTVGFDINTERVRALRSGKDTNGEVQPEALQSPLLHFTSDPAEMEEADFIIIAVPTPVDKGKRPDLSPLQGASRMVGEALRSRKAMAGNVPIVVYESTVYPGCTEEVCVPVIEEASGLKAGKDFKVGYSPERINPGETVHTIENVVKIVSGQDEETLETVARVYCEVVKAGVHKAPDIRTAEAAKVIENVQRDLNISLMNELAVLFHRLGLNTNDVLDAAKTKWNFLPFKPGLVGGHCIPVDPYYLTHRAEEAGYHPEVILAGRRINDSMGAYVAQETIKLLVKSGARVKGASILVLGAAFKEDVPDLRNSRVTDVVQELVDIGAKVSVFDPLADPQELQSLGLATVPDPFQSNPKYDAIVLAVPHQEFKDKTPQNFTDLLNAQDGTGVFVDVGGTMRGLFPENKVQYWNL